METDDDASWNNSWIEWEGDGLRGILRGTNI
jgi:hypothetical protein